jgi:hypothetical protein
MHQARIHQSHFHSSIDAAVKASGAALAAVVLSLRWEWAANVVGSLASGIFLGVLVSNLSHPYNRELPACKVDRSHFQNRLDSPRFFLWAKCGDQSTIGTTEAPRFLCWQIACIVVVIARLFSVTIASLLGFLLGVATGLHVREHQYYQLQGQTITKELSCPFYRSH